MQFCIRSLGQTKLRAAMKFLLIRPDIRSASGKEALNNNALIFSITLDTPKLGRFRIPPKWDALF